MAPGYIEFQRRQNFRPIITSRLQILGPSVSELNSRIAEIPLMSFRVEAGNLI